MKKKIFSVILLLAFPAFTIAQRRIIPGLKIGDIVPDIEITNILNYSTDVTKFSDFKGKLLILDFWATWCSPCIASFSKLDSLQKKFQNKIQILPITQEDKNTVSNFLRKMNNIKKILPTTATEDTILRKLFKHRFLPHYVWIDRNQKVIAITGEYEVTEKNITEVLQGVKTNLPLKDDIKNNIVRRKNSTLFTNPSIYAKVNNSVELKEFPDSQTVIYSVLTRYIEGLAAAGSFDSTQISLTNLSVRYLYKIALYGNNQKNIINSSGPDVELPDSIAYNYITYYNMEDGKPLVKGLAAIDWIKKNGFTYELRVPPSLAGKKFNIMLNHLNDYFGLLFGIEGVIEKRNSKYLALVRNTLENKLYTTGKQPNISSDKFSLKIQNLSLKSFIVRLSLPLQKYPPIIDETGFNGNVDLEINCQLSNLSALNKELAKYGLKLIEKEKLMDKAVIRMKKKQI